MKRYSITLIRVILPSLPLLLEDEGGTTMEGRITEALCLGMAPVAAVGVTSRLRKSSVLDMSLKIIK